MIDPKTQERQKLALVPAPEQKCDRCGRRTRNQTGTCGPCQKASVPKLDRLTTGQVVGLIEMCRAELERRRAEVEAALRGTR